MKKNKKIILLLATVLIIAILFISQFFGIIANSDSYLGLNSIKGLYGSFFSWNDSINAGTYLAFPFFSAYSLQFLFNLINSSISNSFIILILLISIWVAMFFLLKDLLLIKGESSSNKVLVLVAVLASSFSISNSLIRQHLIANITILWGFLFFILSIYFFIRFIRSEKYSFAVASSIATSLSFIDFHTGVLNIIFIIMFFVVANIIDPRKPKLTGLSRRPMPFAFFIMLFFFLNSYWIFNNLNDVFFERNHQIEASYSPDLADSVLEYTNIHLNRVYYNIVISKSSDYEIFKDKNNLYYILDVGSSFAILLLVFLPLLLVNRSERDLRAYLLFFSFLAVFFITFSLGPKDPFGLFNFLWRNLPGFDIFRDFFKFHRILIIVYSVLLAYSLSYLAKKYIKNSIFFAILACIFLIKFFPYFYYKDLYKPFYIPKYYYEFRDLLKNNKNDERITVIPIISSMQIFYWSNDNYDMQDPLKYFSPKSIFMNDALYSESSMQNFNRISSEAIIGGDLDYFLKTLPIRNIKKFVARNDHDESYLFSKEVYYNWNDLNAQIEKDERLSRKVSIGDLHLYELKNEFFLPHFYTPKNTILSERPVEDLPRIVSDESWETRSAVFFREQNDGKDETFSSIRKKSDSEKDEEKLPVLEFRKINPTKYRVRIHGASETFPLVFSESFHQGWKIYLSPSNDFEFKISDSQKKSLDSEYKILDGNEGDQAEKEELKEFIAKGWVTDLGDGQEKAIKHRKWDGTRDKPDYVENYRVDFISKNFQGTIQNDNLPKGKFWETWSKSNVLELPEENHLMANGYANAWAVEVEKICENGGCVKNPDGSWDFELIVEFKPQKLFYIGLFVSGATLLGCFGYLLWDFGRRRRSGGGESGKRGEEEGNGREDEKGGDNGRGIISRTYNLPKNSSPEIDPEIIRKLKG